MDYAVLKLIWWVLVGILLIGFAIMDGYDIGTANLLPFMGKTNNERRIMINAIAPHWDGNQVWLITAGGAILAAWPMVYATAFSGLYWAMILILFSLIMRPIAMDYRSKIDDPRWRTACDWGLFVSGAVPSFVFGVAFGTLFQGFGFNIDDLMRSYFTGHFYDLFTPFSLLCGVVSVSMLSMQGSAWLALRAGTPIQKRAEKTTRLFAIIVIAAFALAGIWIAHMPGFEITSAIDPNAVASPLTKTVIMGPNGQWLANYNQYPWMIVAPVMGFAGAISVILLARCHVMSFISSSISIAGIIMTAGFSLFPFILTSSTHPGVSLTVWDSTSSYLTLAVMTFVAAVFVPVIIGYTTWCFYHMWGRVTAEHIAENTHSLY
ncbi:MAG: cytochrome d ubiquinol oxidase subunit II [Endozoicomonas sp. (ex Botrylloides leachii)]|nr:cytochrome d ubiquinol oxidase subunit II [Endozoicomonas sp. (ex Botrylloides leachii)]